MNDPLHYQRYCDLLAVAACLLPAIYAFSERASRPSRFTIASLAVLGASTSFILILAAQIFTKPNPWMLAAATTTLLLSLGIPRGKTPAAAADASYRILFIGATSLGFFASDDHMMQLLYFAASVVPLCIGRDDFLGKTAERRASLLVIVQQGASILVFTAGALLGLAKQAPLLSQGLLILAVWLRLGLFPFQAGALAMWEGLPYAGVLPFVFSPIVLFILLQHLPHLLAANESLLLNPTLWLGLSIAACLYLGIATLTQTRLRALMAYAMGVIIATAVACICSINELSLHGTASLVLLWAVAGASLGLCCWLTERRFGEVLLHRHHGLARQAPALANLFAFFSLVLVGLPATFGYLTESLWTSAIAQRSVLAAILAVGAQAFVAISLYRAYQMLFLGEAPERTQKLDILMHERLALGFGVLLVVASVIWLPHGA